jgi:hypothetical protein
MLLLWSEQEVHERLHGLMRHARANGDANGMWM